MYELETKDLVALGESRVLGLKVIKKQDGHHK